MSSPSPSTGSPGSKKERARNVSRRGRRVLALILVVLAILLIAVSVFLFRLIVPAGVPTSADQTGGLTWVRSIYGWGPGVNQRLAGPAGIGVAPNGTIWVTDPNNARVLGFNPDGSFNSVLSGAANDRFILPTDVTVDDAGRIYVLEATQDKLHVMTAQNQELLVKRVQSPTSVGVSADRIIVGSEAGFAIMDKEGNLIKIVGTKGKADDQFDTVNGVLIDKDGSFFILDTFNDRLSHWTPDGARLWIKSLGKPANNASGNTTPSVDTSAGPGMQIPSSMTWDGAGRIIVVDPFGFSLNVVSPKDGTLLKTYGAYGVEDGKMTYPAGVSYDAGRDWFAVADTGNNRVQIFRIPDSGASVAAQVRSSLSGPLRACLLPLILLLIAAVVAVINRRRKKRLEAAQAARTSLVNEHEGEGPDADSDKDSVEQGID